VHADGTATLASTDEVAFRSVLEFLKNRTGHDFSRYKRNTVVRRLARRMQLAHMETVADYVRYLGEKSDEIRQLFDDLLITVTTFFRDPEAWSALRARVIVPLVERTGAAEQIRVWVPGCATGEEAYSLAILFEEEFHRRGTRGDFVI
jgi:two-component system CheB/CheR fusion protein